MEIITQILNSVDLTSILGEYTVTKILDKFLFRNKKIIQESGDNSTDLSNSEELENAILKELQNTIVWSQTIKNNQFNITKETRDIYVDLDILLTLTSSSLSDFNNNPPTKKFNEILASSNDHITIVANLGSGKTTLLKKTCLEFAENFKEDNPIPIAIELRELDREIYDISNDLFLFKYLINRFKIKIDFSIELIEIESKFSNNDGSYIKGTKDVIRNTIRKSVIAFLEEWNITLILDGYDEIVEIEKRDLFLEEILYISSKKRNFRTILSTRLGERLPYNSYTSTYELAPIDGKQLDKFISNYLNANDRERSEFIDTITNSTFSDTIRRPLILSFYCQYYNHYGYLPEQPSALYSKVTTLHIEEWSKLNTVKRLSKFSNFNFDMKAKFLREFAFLLTFEHKELIFNQATFNIIYDKIKTKYGLDNVKSNLVLEEIQSHNGLIVPKSANKLSFIHKSIQEYIVAEYLLRLGEIPKFSISKLPNEIAIAIAVSDNPTRFFYRIILECRSSNMNEYSSVLMSRLLSEKPLFHKDALLGLALVSIYNQAKRIEISDTKKKLSHISDSAIFKTHHKILLDYFNEEVFIKSMELLFQKYYKPETQKEFKEYNGKVFFYRKVKDFDIQIKTPKYIALGHQIKEKINALQNVYK